LKETAKNGKNGKNGVIGQLRFAVVLCVEDTRNPPFANFAVKFLTAKDAKEVYQNNIHLFTKSRKCRRYSAGTCGWGACSVCTRKLRYAALVALWICYDDTVPQEKKRVHRAHVYRARNVSSGINRTIPWLTPRSL